MTNTIKRTGRCICGLKLSLHYAKDNRFLTCAEARAAHPRAKVAPLSLRAILCNAGARQDPQVMIFTGLHGLGPIVCAILPRKNSREGRCCGRAEELI